jgi:O-antigen/teichoic acid export membrane protein
MEDGPHPAGGAAGGPARALGENGTGEERTMTGIRAAGEGMEREIDWADDPEAARAMGAPGEQPRPLEEVSRRFSRNVAATIVARVVNMARGVLLVPFLLAHIGLEAYGIWTTIFILVTYVGLTTLGISNVYIKYVAEFHARREYDKANALLSTGLVVTIPSCAAIFLAIYFGWGWIAPWLHLPAAHAADGKEAVLIVLGVFLSSIAFNAFGDMLTGTQQIAATQVFLTISIVAEFGLAVWLVWAGRGIAGLAEAYLARTVINDGLTMWWAWRTLKWLKLSPRLARRASLKYVVHFGGLVQFQSMLSIFLASVERVAALTFIGAAAAGLLDVARKWPLSLSTIPTAFFAALLPAAAHVDAATEGEARRQNLRQLYLTGSRYANLTTAVFVAVLAFWAPPILHVWLGNGLPMRQTLVSLFVVFSLGMQLHMLTGAGTSVFRGMGKVYEEFNYSLPNLLLLAVALPAARWIEGSWTPWGIGVAVTVATALSACVLMGRALVVLDLKLSSYLRTVIVPGLVPYLAAGTLAWPTAWLVNAVNRWAGMGVLAAAGLVYAAAVAVLLDRWVLTGDERNRSAAVLRKGLRLLRREVAEA